MTVAGRDIAGPLPVLLGMVRPRGSGSGGVAWRDVYFNMFPRPSFFACVFPFSVLSL